MKTNEFSGNPSVPEGEVSNQPMVMEFFKENLQALATTLSGVGAANWLFIELFQTDLVELISMGNTLASSSIYVLAGVAGLGAIAAGLSMFEMPDY